MTRPARKSVALMLVPLMFLALASLSFAESMDTPSAEYTEPCPYGISDNPVSAVSGRILSGQTLSDILSSFSVPASAIYRLAHKSEGVFNLKSMRAGNKYSVLKSASSGKPRYMIYEKNPVDFVVFSLKDPLGVYTGTKNVTTDLVAAGWVIERSLWNSVDAAGCDFSLIEHLSDIYSWSVNFQHLQPGDRFSVLYEKRVVAGTPVDVRGVSAARLTHRGRDYYAFRFDSGSGECYYDAEGRSLRKAFLRAPLKYTRITSRFNPGRLHPVLDHERPHLGTDFAAPEGTPVMAVGDGRVNESGYHHELGNHLTVRHNGIYSTQYLHLSRFARGIEPGTEVSQGQVIGYVGSTGLATGPHLELRLWKNGEAVDILEEDLPDSEPLKGRDREEFFSKITSIKDKLDRLHDHRGKHLKLTGLKPSL